MSREKVKTMGVAAFTLKTVTVPPTALSANGKALNQVPHTQAMPCNNAEPELKKRVYMTQEQFGNISRLPISLHISTQVGKKLKSDMQQRDACMSTVGITPDVRMTSISDGLNVTKEHARPCSIIQQPADVSIVREKSSYSDVGEMIQTRSRDTLATYVALGGSRCRLEAFSELSLVLKKLFLGKLNGTEDIILSCDEMMVLSTILIKKFDYEPPVSNIYKVLHLFDEETYRAKKRAEECYKFVFKHAYKNLKRAFCDAQLDNQLANGRALNSLDFYEHYFGEVSAKHAIPLSHFYLPLTPDSYCNKGNKTVPKTINMNYAHLVSKSELFMRDFMDYLTNKFVVDYCELINLKIDHMVCKWSEISLAYNQSEKSIFFICDYIKTNKKCKLPWTVREVRLAIDTVVKMIERANELQRVDEACFG